MKEALLHKDVVINVACSAYASGRTDLLGVLYDEVARPVVSRPRFVLLAVVLVHRKKWEDLLGKLGSSFDLGKASLRDEVFRGLCCVSFAGLAAVLV